MRNAMRWTAVGCGVLAVVLSGCLPIELSVSPKGEILIPRAEGFIAFDPATGAAKTLHAPASEQPAIGLFSPDGKQFLAISQAKGGGMGTSFKVALGAVGAAPKTLMSATNLTYARWSPDGKYVTITRVADSSKAPLDEQLPELVLINTADGSRKTLASNVSVIHRWFPDSKNVLTFQIASKAEDGDQYSGSLVKLDVTTGKSTPLAAVLGEKKVFFDLSPDGGKALFTARKADKAGAKVPEKTEDDPKLHELNIATGAVRAVKEDVIYAIYSPKGTKVLVGGEGEGDGLTLEVGDASLAKVVTVAEDAVKSAGEAMNSVDIYPGWVNDETVYYIASKPVYGTAGKNLQLMTVGADGKNARNLQPAIEAAIAK